MIKAKKILILIIISIFFTLLMGVFYILNKEYMHWDTFLLGPVSIRLLYTAVYFYGLVQLLIHQHENDTNGNELPEKINKQLVDRYTLLMGMALLGGFFCSNLEKNVHFLVMLFSFGVINICYAYTLLKELNSLIEKGDNKDSKLIQRKKYIPITSTNMNDEQKRFVLERLRFIIANYGNDNYSPFSYSAKIGDSAFKLEETITRGSLRVEDLGKLNRLLRFFSTKRFSFIMGIDWLVIFFIVFLAYGLWIVIN